MTKPHGGTPTLLSFVRHAVPDFSVREDAPRPLSEEGHAALPAVCAYFDNETIHAVYASPYRRAADTVAGVAAGHNLPVLIEPRFRERTVGTWVEDFDSFACAQWADFTYKLPGGESLAEVRARNLDALSILLSRHMGEHLVIGCHGTALCTLLSHYIAGFQINDFRAMQRRMPWLVQLRLHGMRLLDIRTHDFLPASPISYETRY